jgi:hypothetical protein
LRSNIIEVPVEMPGLPATRRRVEDDASPHGINDSGGRGVSRGESAAFACVGGVFSRNSEL